MDECGHVCTERDFLSGKEKQRQAEFLDAGKSCGMNSFKDGDFVLLVGEGDFSFSVFLIQHTRAHIVATTLLSSLHTLSERQKRNISRIKKLGGEVHTDVDATRLISHSGVSRNVYKAIIFNFPHIPGKMKISANRDLLRNFFVSTKNVIASEGEVYVTLCKGQGGTLADLGNRKWENTWQITSMAAFSDFVLSHVEPFHVEDYPGYTCSGYRGREKSFHVEGALIHVFKLGHPIIRTLEIMPTSQQFNIAGKHHPLISTQIEMCKKYKYLFETSGHPVAKTLSSVINETRKCSSSNFKIISFPDLLICPGNLCLKHQLKCFSSTEGLPCTVVSLLLSSTHMSELEQQLNTEADVVIISSYSCCPYNLSAFELPVSCNAVFLGRSMGRIINEVHVMLDKFLCKQRCSDIVDDYLGVYDLSQDSSSHQSILQRLLIHKDLLHSSYRENNIKFQEIGTFFLLFSVIQSKSYALRNNVCVVISSKNLKNETHKEVLKLGSVYAVTYNCTTLYCTFLTIEYVSMAKFHIFNHQLLLSDIAYFDAHTYADETYVIYRSASLYPPFYIHDVSFWLLEGFKENELILLMKNLVGDLICDIKLIDSYHEEHSQKKSHCYRFIYQSCDRPLSKENTQYIHTNLIRFSIEKYLNVKLR